MDKVSVKHVPIELTERRRNGQGTQTDRRTDLIS